ncbi:hypothetical protein BDZ90DRAFT_173639 [Jaminaea rosea]|uniref:Mediator of RNA polymerase II transcription subunit 7 n=1 Tax=Jaminaea rosea TaxID=1569628 RepID=A0A316URD2_9BASI|nr:hypothetical protein BDZ90DRAFT_173639 [Jaminaea rosea]PWN27869.1 hypothetical protein BDZ90DRAFT_173639 [Jaminaea rosea]
MDDVNDNNDAGPSSPQYPPLTSASLFPPPPATHIHYTPVNLWLHGVLNEHWEEEALQDEEQEGDDDTSATSKSSSTSPRMKLQRRLLLLHALDALSDPSTPSHITSQYTPSSLRSYILSLPLDLKLELDPPDLNVITGIAQGYHLYGQWWPVPARLPGLEEAGVQRLYADDDAEPGADRDSEGRVDRRPTLLMLLRSFLVTYLKLLSLLQYPPSFYSLRTFASKELGGRGEEEEEGHAGPNGNDTNGEVPEGVPGEEEWHTTSSAQWAHLRTLVLNFQEVLNRSRPSQAARNLERVMEGQVRERREETRRVREKCEEVRRMITRWEGQGHVCMTGKGEAENGTGMGMELDTEER